MNNLKFKGISENLKYLFTNKGIIQTGDYFKGRENGRFIDYSYQNLDIAVDIMQEHSTLRYKTGKISLLEYSNSARKFLYSLVEIIHPENQVNIIKEWEETFGSKLLLINESVDDLLIESRINDSWNSIRVILEGDWYNPFSWDWKGAGQKVVNFAKDTAKSAVDWTKEQGRQIKQKGVLGWAKDKAKAVWDTVSDAVVKAWNCVKKNPVECIMEGIRKGAFSAIGMGVMTAITFVPGVGQIADFIVFGSLLIWDIYKALSGKYESGEYQWSFVDIIVDSVCLLLPALGAGLKAAMRGIRGAGEMASVAAKQGGIIAKAVNALKGGLSKIIGYIGKAASWIGEKLGITWLANFGSKAQSFMTKTVQELGGTSVKAGEKALVGAEKKSLLQKAQQNVQTKITNAKKGGSQFLKDFKFSKPTPVVVKSTGKTIMITAALCAALGVSDPWMCHNKVENGEFTDEQMAEAAKSIGSKENIAKLDQMTDAESKEILGF